MNFNEKKGMKNHTFDWATVNNNKKGMKAQKKKIFRLEVQDVRKGFRQLFEDSRISINEESSQINIFP